MTKRQIKKLAEQSYKQLDEKKIEKITSLLSRKDLKEYVRQLRLLVKAQQVIIALPNLKSYNTNNNFFEDLFKGKQIIYQEDPSLLLGAQITDNDMVYDLSLKSRLEEAGRKIEQDYE